MTRRPDDDPAEVLSELRLAQQRDFNLSFYRDGDVQEDITPLLARAARVIARLTAPTEPAPDPGPSGSGARRATAEGPAK